MLDVVGRLDREPEVLDGGALVDMHLRGSESAEHGASLVGCRGLGKRPTQVRRRRVRRTFSDRAARRLTQRGDDEFVPGRLRQHQVRRCLLRQSPSLEHQHGRSLVRGDPRSGTHRLVHGGSEHRMRELQRAVCAQQVRADELLRRLRRRGGLEVGEHAGLSERGAVTENGSGTNERGRVGRKPQKPE